MEKTGTFVLTEKDMVDYLDNGVVGYQARLRHKNGSLQNVLIASSVSS